MIRPASRTSSTGTSCLVLVALLASACVSPRPRVDPTGPLGETVTVQLQESEAVVTVPLEQYVLGSVLAEADFRGLDREAAHRMAAVQSVLARTYALANLGRHAHEGFQLCATTHCQVYRPVEQFGESVTTLAVDAARTTSGLVMSHDGHPINAVFHADCGGGTSDASVPWGGAAPPYLRGVADPFCVRNNPPPWTFEAARSDVLDALNADDRTSIGPELRQIFVTEYDQAGRAIHVMLRGASGREIVVRGEVLRSALARRFGFRSFKSTRFSILSSGDHLVVEGRGFGHGVGLCQRGAAERARDGHTPEDILTQYYPGARLTRYHY